jgi:hypothetical protein
LGNVLLLVLHPGKKNWQSMRLRNLTLDKSPGL